MNRKVSFTAALIGLIPVLAFAQYFGRNKVQYKSFDFFEMKTNHFLVYHYPKGIPAVMDAAGELEKWYGKHADFFNFGLGDAQKVILYNDFRAFQQTNAVFETIEQGTGGLTESLGNRMVLYLTGIEAEDSHVLGHELVHAFQFKALKRDVFSGGYSVTPPLWFIEGLAEYRSKGDADNLTAMWMRDALLNSEVPSIDDLSRDPRRYFPYRFGQAVWAFVARQWGEKNLRPFFQECVAKGVSRGIESSLGVTYKEFSRKWQDDFSARLGPGMEGRSHPKDTGRALTAMGTEFNLSPVISPDGKYIALFSKKDLFTVDLFLADAESGKLLKTLASSDTDADLGTLLFIDSAGAWSPDSRSFAFVAYRGGEDAIAIVEVSSGKTKKVIPLKEVAGVSNLSWSPDGSRIALSGSAEGIRDIYLLDPADGKLERLTEGRGAEIQPAWSPDGKTLAFATDGGGTTMNLGLMDVESRSMEVIALTRGAKHINPVFSPDGRGLYFVCDADGFSDIYRYDLDSRAFFRVTKVSTGISGLAELSPCLSVASGTGELVFGIFNKGSYEVHVLAPGEAPGEALAVHESETTGQPKETPAGASRLEQFSISPYRPSFSLTSVSQIGVGVAATTDSASLFGAAKFLFQDTLGNHDIFVAAQTSGSLESTGGQVVYMNKTNRLNWGFGVAHIPETDFSLLPRDEFEITGADAAIVRHITFTEEADLMAKYPLSANRRIEAALGYTLIRKESTASVDYILDGERIGKGKIDVIYSSPLHLAHGGLAYVGDYSFFGFTDPVRGYRYRFEAEQTAGSLLYLTALADARAYFFVNPLTLAFRAYHLGRYLQDSESGAISEFYLGRQDLVRGYSFYSIVAEECDNDVGADCPEMDRLYGTKLAVFNAELRIHILGTKDLGLVDFPYLGTDLVGFFDAGLAWTNASTPVFRISGGTTERVPVFSAGAAVRINVLGAFVLQIYWAYPFQRPEKTEGEWGFFIGTGW